MPQRFRFLGQDTHLFHISPAIQTLGEEYTDIWQYSTSQNSIPPSPSMRTAVILASLIPSYVMGRWGHSSALNNSHPTVAKWFIIIPTAMDIATEVNLAVFYLRGSYYDLIKRLIGIQHVSLPSPSPLHLNLTVPRYPLSQKTLIHDLHRIHYLEF